MRTHARLWALCTVVLALGCWFVTTGGDRDVNAAQKAGITIPDEDFKLLVESSNKVIQESLAGKPDKRAAAKARTAAIYIALYAQADQGAANAAQRAAVRDQALKVADLIKDGKTDEAKKEAADLATLKPGAQGKPGATVALAKQIELDEVMMHFHRTKLGGTDLEYKLLGLASLKENKQKKAIIAKETNNELLVMAYQAAIVTDFVKDHNPGKNQKNWTMHAVGASAAGLELAKAIKADKGKDSKNAWTALNKLNATCTDCHNQFK